jgi:hypothetical protein
MWCRFMRFIRRVCLLCVVLLALGVFLYVQLIQRVDKEILKHVHGTIQSSYPNLVVKLRDAKRYEGHGIEIRGLQLIDPKNPNDVLVEMDELFVHCRATLQELSEGNIEPESISVRGLRINVIRDTNGVWSINSLLPFPKLSGNSADVVIHQAELRVHDQSRLRAKPILLRLKDFTIRKEEVQVQSIDPLATSNQVLSNPAHQSEGLAQPVSPAPPTAAQHIVIHGELEGDDVQSVSVRGRYDPQTKRWLVHGAIDGLNIAPRIVQSLPSEMAKPLRDLNSLQGSVDATYWVSNENDPTGKIQYVIDGNLSEGTVVDSRLPHGLTNVQAHFRAEPQRVHFDQAVAFNGVTQYTVEHCDVMLTQPPTWYIKGRAQQVRLNDQLARVLPETGRRVFDNFSPAGIIDADIEASSDGLTVTPNVTIHCRELTSSFYRFPYPLEGITGTIQINGDKLTTQNLQALANGQVVDIKSEFTKIQQIPIGWMEFNTQKPTALDQKLMTALKKHNVQAHQLVQSLRPTGFIQVNGRIERTAVDTPLKKKITIDVTNATVNYEKFPYPMRQVSGRISLHKGTWTFQQMTARNDSAYIVIDGSCKPDPVHGHRLELNLDASDVPLEDELRDALPETSQKVWSNVSPRGTLDSLAVKLIFGTATKKMWIEVDAHKRNSKFNIEGRSLSIRPVWFPYALNELVGSLHYQNGLVTFTNCRGNHNQANISLNGEVTTKPNGNWQVSLTDLAATQIRPNRDLLRALPPQVRDTVIKTGLNGPMSIAGNLAFAGGPGLLTTSSWNVGIDIEDGNTTSGLVLDHIRGGVTLNGYHNAKDGVKCDGEFKIDSLVYQNLLLTWIRGPFHIQNDQILVGSWAPMKNNRPPRRATANSLGGITSLDAQVKLIPNSPYSLYLTITQGKLNDIVQEFSGGGQNIAGRVRGSLELSGNATGSESWFGQGSIQLEEADIYELPLIVALLTPLRAKPLERSAFTSANLNYRIVGQHIYLDPIVLTGDTLTLRGVGKMKLDRTIDMRFYTLVGNDQQYLPILRPVFGVASSQFLEIQLGGTLDHPEITRKAFPKVNETLRQLFPEIETADNQDTQQINGQSSRLRFLQPR